MSYKINLEQLTTSQLRAVFFNLRLARFDNLKNSQILTEIDVALDQINLAFRAFESKIFMPIEAFIPAEAVSASKISCSLSMSSGFLEVIANFAISSSRAHSTLRGYGSRMYKWCLKWSCRIARESFSYLNLPTESRGRRECGISNRHFWVTWPEVTWLWFCRKWLPSGQRGRVYVRGGVREFLTLPHLFYLCLDLFVDWGRWLAGTAVL